METLDLYKERRPYTVILEVKGGKKTFKIPTELTVEESERMLEAEIRVNALAKQEVEEETSEEVLDRYFNNLLEYILVLLEHYQPDLTMEKLKKMLTRAEVVRIFEFFKKQRFLTLLGLDGSTQEAEPKKKTETAETRLDTLRQSITFLVLNGFGLLEVRKLYIDELLSFYNSLIYIKEKQGELKEGTYKSLKNQSKGDVVSLKNQIFNIQSNGKQ